MKKIISVIAILLADIVSLALAFYAAYFIRVELIQDLFKVSNPYFFPLEHFYDMYYLLFVFILIFFYEKLYAYHRRYSMAEEFLRIGRGLFLSVVLIAVLVYLSRAYETFTRTIPVLMMFTGMVTVPLLRYLVKWLLRVSGFYLKRTTVVGLEQETTAVLPSLEKLAATGYKICQVATPEQLESADNTDTLVIVAKGLDNERLNRLINTWENRVKEIKMVTDTGYLKTMGVETEYVDELLVMRMANNLLSPANRFFKQVFDLVVSFFALVMLLPLFVIIAVLIKLDSRGPVFFIQERFGKGGKRFNFIKFRSMYMDGDERLKEYLAQSPEMQEEWDRFKKLKTHDPRVTGIGKFLRRFSLDEAPQLLNVLLGQMSIVGPRPYLVREKEEIEKSAAIIFRVKSGLTGLWQIRGRSELSFESRLKLDEFYVRNWSFLLDITIILRTFGAVLKGRGAY